MSTCKLFETIHNIWLQNFGKRGGCFYVATFDDYVYALKQNALYMVNNILEW